MKRWLATALLGLVAYAAPEVSPQGIIVNPVPTDLSIQTWVGKDASGNGNPLYTIGERITIYVQVNQSAYVYLFNINANGQIDLIMPNPYAKDNLLRAGETRVFPPSGAQYSLTIAGPEGNDQVLAIASRQPLSLGEIADIQSGQMRLQGADNLARALSIVVTPLPQRDWKSDVARYRVIPQQGQTQPNTIKPVPIPAPGAQLPLVAGQRVMQEQRQPNRYVVIYAGNASTLIFDHYNKVFTDQGWTKAGYNFNREDDEQQGTYRKGNEQATLNVRNQGSQVQVIITWSR